MIAIPRFRGLFRPIGHTVIACLFFLLLPPLTGTFAVAQTNTPEATSIRVATYNIRLNTPADSADAWPYRSDRVIALVKFHGFQIFGVQEALKRQMDDLAAGLPGFGWTGVGRDDGKEAGEYSAIFYDKHRFKLLKSDTFWLSETPSEPGSKSWDAAITRVCSWGLFEDLVTGRQFYHFNTHFDHRGETARRESAGLIVDQVKKIAAGKPVILTGDFNMTDETPGYATLTSYFTDTLPLSKTPHYGPRTTFHGFLVNEEPGDRIDYLFIHGDIEVIRHGTLTDQLLGHYPSDHLPVTADVVIR